MRVVLVAAAIALALPAGETGAAAVPLARCGSSYADGFLLAHRAECIALRVSEAGRSRVVRFGLGRRCT